MLAVVPLAENAETLEASTHPLGRSRIGPYELTGLVGEGGMAVVFRARSGTGEPVALKVIRTTLAGSHARERFRREAGIRIEHENVVRVLDAGTDEDGTPFIAFELLEGESLRERLDRGVLPLDELLPLALDLCRGLAAVHAAGVVHRDLKPANIFVTRGGRAKVLDFGVAHLASRETQLTVHGHVVGTPAYLAPEQARGEPADDPRVDVWAVGAVLYECLTGVPPFEKETALGTMLATLVEPLVPPSERAEVPASLERVVLGALAKRAEDRWPSVGALAEALAAVDPGETASRRAVSERPPGLIASGEQRVVVLVLAEAVIDREALRRVIEGHGGELLGLAGERAIGLFGHRRTEGDEVRRATRAALTARPTALRMSVGAGRASQEGGGLAGEALRDAERGSGVWTRGVVVSPAIARQLGDASLRELGDGLAELREEAEARRTRATVLESKPAVLLGRGPELELLRAAERTALAHQRPTVILATGPLGIGKTRLIDELPVLREAAPACTILEAAAEAHRAESSFALLAALVRSFVLGLEAEDDAARWRALRAEIAAHVDDLDVAEEHARFLGDLVGIEVPESAALLGARRDPQLMHDRVQLAFVELIEGLLRERGVVLRVEDLHWADDASMRVLEELPERMAGRPLLLALSARPELDATARFTRGHLVSLRLDGLGAADVAALAQRVAGQPVADTLAAELHERSAGNPAFVEQIVSSLVEDRAFAQDGAELPLPLTVQVAVQSRLDHLSADEKELCKRAAVLDPPFTSRELAALGRDDLGPAIPALVRRGLFRRAGGAPEPRFRFANELVREVAYDMLAEPRRRELHRLAGEHLAALRDRDLERVGAHFFAAGEAARAAGAYVAATAAAARRCDTDTVLRCSERALALDCAIEARFELFFARADALRFKGDREAQARALESALAAAASDLERARVRIEQVALLTRTGRVTEANDAGRDAIAAARQSGDVEALVMALARSAAARIYAGEADEAARLLDEAAASIDRVGPKSAAYVEAIRAELAAARGKLGERRDAWLRAVRHLLRAGDLRLAASMENNLADLYNRVGMYAEAEAALEKAIERGRQLGYRLLEGYASVNLGYARMRSGDRDRARAALADAERIAREAEDPRLELTARLYAARLEGSREAAIAIGERADALKQPATRAAADTVAGWAALAAGDLDEADARSESALRRRDELGGLEEDEAEVFLLRGAVLEARGRAEEARAILARGAARLDEVAAGIEEPEWRRRFLEGVEAHRRLRDAAR